MEFLLSSHISVVERRASDGHGQSLLGTAQSVMKLYIFYLTIPEGTPYDLQSQPSPLNSVTQMFSISVSVSRYLVPDGHFAVSNVSTLTRYFVKIHDQRKFDVVPSNGLLSLS